MHRNKTNLLTRRLGNRSKKIKTKHNGPSKCLISSIINIDSTNYCLPYQQKIKLHTYTIFDKKENKLTHNELKFHKLTKWNMSKNIYQLLHIYIMSASSQFRPKLTQTQTKNSHKLNTRHSMHCLLNLIKLSNPGKGTYLRPIKWVSYNFNSI